MVKFETCQDPHLNSKTQTFSVFFSNPKNPSARRHEISLALFQNLSKPTCFIACVIALLNHFSLLLYSLLIVVVL